MISYYFPTFLSCRPGRAHAGHTGHFGRREEGCLNLKCAGEKYTHVSVGQAAGEQHWSFQKYLDSAWRKANCVCICVSSTTLCVCVCYRVYTCLESVGQGASKAISFQIWPVSLKIFTQYFFSSQAKWTSLIVKIAPKDLMENKCRSIWNSWVDFPGPPSVSPCLFVFQRQGGDEGCVDSKGIWFVFCYRHHEGLLLQMVRNRTNLKQLCALVSSDRKKKKKNTLVSLPSNMFHNLLLWCCDLYGFFIILFTSVQ